MMVLSLKACTMDWQLFSHQNKMGEDGEDEINDELYVEKI